MQKNRLGRGLDALLPGSEPVAGDSQEETAPATVHPSLIVPNPNQPRRVFDDEKIDELAGSIEASGMLQPLVVRTTAAGYELIAGERRLRAARRLGLTEVPIIIHETPDPNSLLLALVENLQREDLNPVEEAAAFFEVDPEGGSGQVVVERSYPETSLPAELDPEQVHQVVLNLLLNAAQAMPGGGVIHLEVLNEAGAAETQIRIRDEGPGIDAEIRKKLFTPFFTTKEDGTGLGLVTSKKIVEAHGGRITLESNPGKGSCFTIALPH